MNSVQLKKAMRNTAKLYVIILCVSVLSLFGCQPNNAESVAQQAVQVFDRQLHTRVPMRLHYASQSLDCADSFTHGQNLWQLERLAFFTSEWQLFDPETNAWQAVNLLTSDWQTQQVALLWFEQQCTAHNELLRHHSIELDVTPALWQRATQLRFTLAVPFHSNHLNPLTQPSPLNIPEMFWSWRMGFKFVRFDMRTNSNELGSLGWSYHLGSIGCQSASSMRPPEQACQQPNRLQVSLNKLSANNTLVFDIAALLKDIEPTAMGGCMFHRDNESSCDVLWHNLQTSNVIRWQGD
ncbi:metallo-mystery pair system four-Cys motif protein [Alteromonas sp. ASW11-36]|uniref:Metallo-mystery pair system four-Cys motif protein n=1 Tax=Alteromonas arenosi TaxID=3055817 RepID=A0ABT7T0G2_9ALTE|nr:MbnP family copper-binding protein [Alteromonas sp. ASW11-36]MDM7861925.1 metallo-mystery pair system four-Cys motif protein [Alteromonas sp. ASW11-36]